MADVLSDTQDLIDRAGHGDETAGHRLLGPHRDYLHRMVAARLDRWLVARIDASNVVQEALVVGFR